MSPTQHLWKWERGNKSALKDEEANGLKTPRILVPLKRWDQQQAGKSRISQSNGGQDAPGPQSQQHQARG